MARQNVVILNGWLVDKPEITYDSEGNPSEGYMMLRTIRGTRFNGEITKNLKYDNHPIISRMPHIVKEMAKLQKGEIIEVKGFLASENVILNLPCPQCEHMEQLPNVWLYVQPVYIISRNNVVESENIVKPLKKLAEISNIAYITGTVCIKPAKLGKDTNGTPNTNYTLAIDRSFNTHEQTQDNKIPVDYLQVKVFGKQAIMDYHRLNVGSTISIDGALQTRWNFGRKHQCSVCGEEFAFQGYTTEIRPYSVEYSNLRNRSNDDEEKTNTDSTEQE